MGAYVSIPECRAHYNITVICDYNVTDPIPTIGGLEKGEIPTDPDVAGVGVVSSFLATTSLALLLSIASVLWLIAKRTCMRKDPDKHKKKKRNCNFSFSELCETLVLGCSDTQIFTGGAYAITMRYFKGCSVISYHYDIIVNFMLLTCATHLMSITIVRNYWQWPWLGLLRTAICTGVFIVTGILLANQNSTIKIPFPIAPPIRGVKEDPLLLPAACFQQGDSQLPGALITSLSTEGSQAAFVRSTPGNRIPGWNNYLIILLLYVSAGVIDIMRIFRRGFLSKRHGKRGRIVAGLRKGLAKLNCRSGQRDKEISKTSNSWWGSIIFFLFCIYLLGGIGVSAWTVVQSAAYIMDLRRWAKESGWLKMEAGNQSAEDDATSFGQLVPIFTNVILLFNIAQLLSKACWRHTDRKFDIYGGVVYDPGEDHASTKMGDRPPSASKSHVGVQVHQYSAVPHSIDADMQPISLSAPAPAPSSAPASVPAATAAPQTASTAAQVPAPVPAPAPSGRWDSGRWSSTMTHTTSESPPPPNRWQNSPTPPSIPEGLHSTPTPPLQPQHARSWSSSQQMAQQTTGSWAALQQPETLTSSYSQPHRVASYPPYADNLASQPAVSEYYPTSQHSSAHLGSTVGSTTSVPATAQQTYTGSDGRQYQWVPVTRP
ncbi:hypothetical protein QBC34DRAFT_427801 [Podospora aff. communis PSN243]|uniref:Uncharacterized protein n=1 Tax=Podospora aff. communis PSN243 TaxID=3040156 RepID=A0AAV9GDV4_9PEZI|nr:hypothetical protein QBC34DRAFT_427801 [Podospora aff. communis PSN243]